MGVINYNNQAAVAAFKYPIGVPNLPASFESYYYDDATKTQRPYKSTAEVISYLNTAASRRGHKTLFVQVGSTLVGGSLSGGEIKEYWFKDGVSDTDLVEKTAALPATVQFVTLAGREWNVRKNRKVIINLTQPLTVINTEDFPAGKLAEALVKQPAAGGNRLIIDSQEVGLNTIGGKLVGDTSLILRYINGQLIISADPNAIVTKPVLDTQSGNVTALAGSDDALFYAKFKDLGRTLNYRWEKDGSVQYLADGKTEKHKGASILMEGVPENRGSWECIAIDAITKLETRSEPMVFRIGEPQPVFVVSGPESSNVNAGDPFKLTAEFGGTPPPEVKCIEVTAIGQDGIPTGPTVSKGNVFNGIALYTKTYSFIGTNVIQEWVETKPAVLVDGFIETPAVMELQKKTYTAFTAPVTITPKKQVQAPPINFVMNDQLDTAAWTDQPGKTPQDCEISIAGAPYIDVTTYPVPVGDRDIAINLVEVRYKETLTHYQSDDLKNTGPYTGSVQPFTAFSIEANSWTKSGNSYTCNTSLFQPGCSLTSPVTLPKLAGAYVEAAMNYGGSNNTPQLVLDPNSASNVALEQQTYGIYGYQGNVTVTVNRTNITPVHNAFVNGDIARFRITNDLKLAIETFNGGQWYTHATVDYPNELYIKAYGIAPNSSMTTTSKGL